MAKFTFISTFFTFFSKETAVFVAICTHLRQLGISHSGVYLWYSLRKSTISFSILGFDTSFQ